MNYAWLYIKYVVVVLLMLVMLATFSIGCGAVLIGVLGFACTGKLSFLVLIPVGVLSGFIGFTALDGIIYITDRWKWKI
jgi:hypothetical protein